MEGQSKPVLLFLWIVFWIFGFPADSVYRQTLNLEGNERCSECSEGFLGSPFTDQTFQAARLHTGSQFLMQLHVSPRPKCGSCS